MNNKITSNETKALKELKNKMVDALCTALSIPNLDDQDRQILIDMFKELSDERSSYDIRRKAFAKRDYIIDGITRKYAMRPSCIKPVVAFEMFEDGEIAF